MRSSTRRVCAARPGSGILCQDVAAGHRHATVTYGTVTSTAAGPVSLCACQVHSGGREGSHEEEVCRLQPRRCVRNGSVVGPHAGGAASRRTRTAAGRDPRTGSGQDACHGPGARRRRLAARLHDTERRARSWSTSRRWRAGTNQKHMVAYSAVSLRGQGRDEARARHAEDRGRHQGGASTSGSSTSRRCKITESNFPTLPEGADARGRGRDRRRRSRTRSA